MKSKENQDIRSQLLLWLQPFIFLLLVIVFVLTLRTSQSGSYARKAYILLIGLLAIIDAVAFTATLKRNYTLSSLLTVGIALVGSWGAILIDSRLTLTQFFPLIYVTVVVLLSSMLLPIVITVAIASVQQIVLTILILQSPSLRTYNWPSFLSYVFIISVLCIVANYISSLQLKNFKESSIRDHLTGLLNRRYFDVTLEDRIKRGSPKGFTYGILLIDIDNFKNYNDQYNHATGDIILQRVASFLSENLERHSIVCRHGGDEFAIIISETVHEDLYKIAQKLRKSIKAIDITDVCQTGEQLSFSIGLALFPKNGKSAEDLMAHADRNLMLAKEKGKDRVMPE